jgi:hypothetical protein
MRKFVTVLAPALLAVIVAQWLVISRLWHENDRSAQEEVERSRFERDLRDARERADRSRMELEKALQIAKQHEIGEQSLRAELAGLRGQGHSSAEVDPSSYRVAPGAAANSASLDSSVPRPGLTVPQMASYDLNPTNVNVASVRITGREPDVNVLVMLPGVPPEDIEAISGHVCDISLDGLAIAKSASQLTYDGTNAGLVFVVRTRAEADALAATLRGQSKK